MTTEKSNNLFARFIGLVHIRHNVYLSAGTAVGERIYDRNWNFQPIPTVESAFISLHLNDTLFFRLQAIL